ncbi:MAG: LysR family transcriptional regulator [Lachnospiraceae bacterium]|nr:LysR family transcriptional regulator [Candidatus Colinaster scatohippi]
MHNDLNLNLYHIFYQVALSRNISAAAKELYISQPAISKAISRLEQSLNANLFIRNSRGVTLTPEGEVLFEQIQNAFKCIQTGEEKLKLATELGIGHLSIGVSTTLCKYVLMPYLKEFVRINPHIKVSISCMPSIEAISALENGLIDIGLVRYPQTKTDLLYKPVTEIHDTFVATSTYLDNFSKRNELTNESLISNATFMMLDKDNVTRKYVDSALALNNIELPNVIEITNLDLLVDFAKIDLGISAVIKEFVSEELKNGTLKEIPLLTRSQGRQIGFAYSEAKKKENPSLDLFLECCK